MSIQNTNLSRESFLYGFKEPEKKKPRKKKLAIVGAGTAGLEIAKNASRSGFKVCLIEQGYSEGKSYLNKIPLLSGKLLQNDKHCLSFISKKQSGLEDRELPILQGIGFGGSSLINGNVSYLGFEKRFEEVFSFWPKNMFQRVKKLSLIHI